MDEIVEQALSPQKTSAALISTFAIGALLLAAMGWYGVVSGSVTRRRHELAVRLALGADHGRVVRLVLKEGAVLVMMGLVIGAPGIAIIDFRKDSPDGPPVEFRFEPEQIVVEMKQSLTSRGNQSRIIVRRPQSPPGDYSTRSRADCPSPDSCTAR